MPEQAELLSQYYVKLDGTDASEGLFQDLVEISVESSLHLPDVATLVLHDPRLTWVDDAHLAPGKTLEISAKGESGETRIFEGEIVELESEFGTSTHDLRVRAFDRLHRLGRGQKVRTFVEVTDGDLIQTMAGEVGLSAAPGPSSPVHVYLLQANETNLDFLRARASALGCLLFVRGRTLHMEPPSAEGDPVEVRWGETLLEFLPHLTTVGQPVGVSAQGWDPNAKRQVVGEPSGARGAPSVGDGRSGGEVAQDAFLIEARHLVADRPLRTKAEADLVAQGEADRAASRYVEAEGTCRGNPAITAGAQIRVDNVGERFSGTYFVTSATHDFGADSGFTTRFVVSGLHPTNLLSLLTPGREQPRFPGLVVGVVTDCDDPDRKGRVKVKYPWLSEDHTSDWARVIAPGAGAERGVQFLPEVNDEVLVGFELGDLRFPYVLGGLWNGVDALPDGSAVSGGRVERRVIRSRSGHEIILDDTAGSEKITIVDKSGANALVVNSSDNSMEVKAQGDLKIETQGKVTIKAAAGLEMSTQAQLSIEGSAGTSLSNGVARVELTGPTVNINSGALEVT